MRRKHPARLLVLLLAVSLIAAACGGDNDDDGGGQATDTTVAVPEGGTLVIGAEQEWDCADWISSCAGASWGTWTFGANTMPRAFDVARKGDNWEYVPSILLDGEPELVTEPKQKVTYTISDEAVWSDGTPITSKDFKYTWEQITTGDDIYDTTGFADIESVDDSVPKTVVVTFEKVFADWKGLFGVLYGVFPAHLLEGKDRNAEMATGYTFSGGPWMMEPGGWQKGTSLTLIPNPRYWGDKPKLDKVVFQFLTDTSTEFKNFKEGQVLVIYPQPQPDAVEQITEGIPDANSEYSPETGNLEALWFNNGRAPFNDARVRQAWGYAIDRDALVERLFGAVGVEAPMHTLNPPIIERFTDTEAWADYKPDLDKVNELMTAAGWIKGADGIWAKGGRRFTAEMKTTTGNKRRELTEQIVQEQLRAAGFPTTINNQLSNDLFGQQLPQGNFQVALYAQVLTSISPSNCNILCSKNIPTAANDFSGQNWQRVNLPEIDPLLEAVDNTLDDDVRAENQKKADAILARENVALPLDPLPNILLWSKRVVGPVSDNPILGPFAQLHRWGVRS